MTAISSDFLCRLQREVAPGEKARFEVKGTLIEFIPRKPIPRTAGALMVLLHSRKPTY